MNSGSSGLRVHFLKGMTAPVSHSQLQSQYHNYTKKPNTSNTLKP